ncbi:hypothetical protein ACIBL3_26945 [Kribbella sp. NPDC050124]|uniref:hypothetical protein n=1 Tax=Kribbella sp. NPDC050124 TaxID=3364114 RepID=UPI0037915AAB
MPSPKVDPVVLSDEERSALAGWARRRYTGYTWDVRNLVDTVKAGESPTGSLDTWSYTYDPRGLRSTVTKPNGNVTTQTYHEDGLLRTLVEKRGQQLITSHSLRFNADGDRSQDVEKVLQA